MSKKILLTSFQTWLPHHKSNSSDDLLEVISQSDFSIISLNFLRQLPVNIPLASRQTIQYIKKYKPDIIICCGMAEKRDILTIESNATWKHKKIETSVNLKKIINQLSYTKISHNAGKFVCEGLYYRVLNYLKKHHHQSDCIFIHVPILTNYNLPLIFQDMEILIKYMVSQND
jgi:pyroglutamyl-peptidase